MKCPICDVDLSPLDLASRTEHVDLCIENGPSVVELDEFGRPTVKRNVPANKQRKICPICDKTFTNLCAHFKTCAIKHDVPPHMMLEHWEAINRDVKNPKQFPCELFDSFVAKCMKENRVGDQVDIARALSLSMGKKDPLEECSKQQAIVSIDNPPADQVQPTASQQARIQDAVKTIMQNASVASTSKQPAVVAPSKKTKVIPKTRLQSVDDDTKRSNVLLRVERELSVTRSRRYTETLALGRVAESPTEDEECMIIPQLSLPATQQVADSNYCDTLFSRSRMKNCDSSEACSQGLCDNHELELLLKEFQPYSGTSMHPLVKEMKEPAGMFANSSTVNDDTNDEPIQPTSSACSSTSSQVCPTSVAEEQQ